MPFFPGNAGKHTSDYKKNRTSPVRNSLYYNVVNLKPRENRALLPASPRHKSTGSLSVEAALVLSLFLFSCVCLAAPMKLFDQQRRIQGILEKVGEDLSQYAYVKYILDKGDTELGLEEDVTQLLALGYVRQQVMRQVDQEKIQGVSFAESRILEDDNISLIMNYRMKLPFSIFGISSIPVRSVCVRRAWIGADGGPHGVGEDITEEDEIVYVGKNPTRYHITSQCHYLSNDLRAVSISQVDSLRNESGGKYYACVRCGSEKNAATVYIMPYGSSYHTSSQCSAINAYVRAVRKSQVAYLGACSYCGGG